MDETLRETAPQDDWRGALAQTIEQQRRKVGERVVSQRERLRELEGRIAAQLDDVMQQLSHQQDEARAATNQGQSQDAAAGQRAADLERRAEEFSRREQDLQAARMEFDQRQRLLLEDLAARLNQLDQRQAALGEEAQKLSARQQEIARREAELEQLRAGLEGQSAAHQDRADNLTRQQAALAAARDNQEAEARKHHQQVEELRRLESSLAIQSRALVDREREAIKQRRHIAQQLRAKKKELAAEIERHRAGASSAATGQELPLQMRLSELQGRYDRVREELEQRQQERDAATNRLSELKAQLEARQHEIHQQQATLEQAQRREIEFQAERQRLSGLQQQLDEARRQAEAAHAAKAELEQVRRDAHQQIEQLRTNQDKSSADQVVALRTQLDALRAGEGQWEQKCKQVETELASLKKAAGGSSQAAAELAKLREEHKQLETWLEEAEEKAKQAGSGGGQDMDDLRRRFEMAVQDVRELKTKNAELTDQLSKAKARGADAGGGGGDAGGQDWESLKQRMLAELESDFDDGSAVERADKLTVQGAIKITDQVVADKEHELAELKKMLDNQSKQVGEVAVVAAAVAQMLDMDELVKQERETLKRLQESLREQLRKAEVDISLERAKVARERAEVDEKMRGFEADRASMPPAADASGDKGKKQPAGRKWLTRLGLGDGKSE